MRCISGCADNNVLPDKGDPVVESGFITITLNCSEGFESRAEGDYIENGSDLLNENRINSVILVLYSEAGNRTEEDKPNYVKVYKDLGAVGTCQLKVPLTADVYNNLYMENTNGTCNAFVAVNVPVPEGEITVSALRKMVINSEFNTKKTQPQFAMDGSAKVTFDIANFSAKGHIDLQRSAAKITLALDVAEEVSQINFVNGEMVETLWQPDYDGMSVRMISGVKTSTLDPVRDEAEDYFDTAVGNAELVYGFQSGNTDNGNDPGENEYPYIQDCPFYTYPNWWKNDDESPNATFLILCVPWKEVGKDTYRECYYQVPVIPVKKEQEIIRNHSYHVYLHVSALGSFIPDQPLPLEECSYKVVEWGKESINVDIKDFRYLVVDSNTYSVNNSDNISIPFYTSHRTVVTKATMTFYRYNFSDEGAQFKVTVDYNSNQNNNSINLENKKAKVFECDFDNETSTLNVNHSLNIWQPYKANGDTLSLTNGGILKRAKITNLKVQNNTWIENTYLKRIAYFMEQNEAEFSRIEFDITVQHFDMTSTENFKETIHIEQYPAIYIASTPNFYHKNGGALKGTGEEASCGINGRYDSSGDPVWNKSIGLSTGNFNWNPNLYLITITALPAGTPYKIGDPRSDFINNSLTNASIANQTVKDQPTPWNQYGRFKDMNGTTRTLSYYYPTLENDETKMMIAPKIRVCSSYGGSSRNLSREMARQRCAAYQEMGFPAGRWRLPTYGEVSFIMELSAKQFIPRLFGCTYNVGPNMTAANGDMWYYWCAQGAVEVPSAESGKGPSLPERYSQGVTTSLKAGAVIKDSDLWRARFVYDEWYWNDTVPAGTGSPRYPFTWGDAKK
ncbi:MAG: hypothetical protein K2M00_01950 [Muribaculaceae bacterium]|nr:hypothetical protein [Muribaculaceae bacterium]